MASTDNTNSANNEISKDDSVKSHILNKLQTIEDDKDWKDWTLEEKKELLKIYLLICKKEEFLFGLIYHNHGCDSWERIFRDYDSRYLDDKADGVEEALNLIEYYSKL